MKHHQLSKQTAAIIKLAARDFIYSQIATRAFVCDHMLFLINGNNEILASGNVIILKIHYQENIETISEKQSGDSNFSILLIDFR